MGPGHSWAIYFTQTLIVSMQNYPLVINDIIFPVHSMIVNYTIHLTKYMLSLYLSRNANMFHLSKPNTHTLINILPCENSNFLHEAKDKWAVYFIRNNCGFYTKDAKLKYKLLWRFDHNYSENKFFQILSQNYKSYKYK